MFLQTRYDFLHDSICLFVVHRALVVLQGEVDGVALLAFGEVFPFVDVEEGDGLEVFLLRTERNLFDARELERSVDEEGEVARDGGIFAYLDRKSVV